MSNGYVAGRHANEACGRRKKGNRVMKYVCDVCGWVYDPEVGDLEGEIPPGTPFEDVPDEWLCPECGVSKDEFSPVDE